MEAESGSPTTAPDSPKSEPPEARDAEDDPAAPRALPRSSELEGWIKTEAVQVAPAGETDSLVQEPALRSVFSGFRLDRVARCRYESPNATAEMVVVEATSPEDAFGAFSILSGGRTCGLEADGSLRAAESTSRRSSQEGPGNGGVGSGVVKDKLVLSAWQGNVLLRADCLLKNPSGQSDCERLLSRTVFGLPMSDPPLLIRAIKDIEREVCRMWVVRSAALLKRVDNLRLRQLRAPDLDSRLGLHGDALLSVVSVEKTKGAAPLILWLVEYPSAEEARAAGERYVTALESDPHGMDVVTFVGSPKGRFLMGTWSADQEMARNLVKLLEQALPES